MDLYTKYRLQKLIASQSKRKTSAKFLRALIYLFLRYVCFTMGLRHVNAQLRIDNILRPFWVQMLFLFKSYLFTLFLFVLLLLHRKSVRTPSKTPTRAYTWVHLPDFSLLTDLSLI